MTFTVKLFSPTEAGTSKTFFLPGGRLKRSFDGQLAFCAISSFRYFLAASLRERVAREGLFRIVSSFQPVSLLYRSLKEKRLVVHLFPAIVPSEVLSLLFMSTMVALLRFLPSSFPVRSPLV